MIGNEIWAFLMFESGIHKREKKQKKKKEKKRERRSKNYVCIVLKIFHIRKQWLAIVIELRHTTRKQRIATVIELRQQVMAIKTDCLGLSSNWIKICEEKNK